MLAILINIPAKLGYLALAGLVGGESMGVPLPGETALIAAGLLANKGGLNIFAVIAVAAGAAIVGDNAGYFIGRKAGRWLLERPGPLRRHRREILERGEPFFERHGPKAVFIGRWIALVRFATAWLAGINRMPFKQFFFWNALGGITWGVTYGLVGYYGGQAAANVLAEAGIAGLVLLLIAPVAIYLFVKRRERRMTERSD